MEGRGGREGRVGEGCGREGEGGWSLSEAGAHKIVREGCGREGEGGWSL